MGLFKRPKTNPADDPTSLGRLLLSQGLVTEKQLAEAVRQKGNGHAHMPIGEILVEMGVISHAQLELALVEQRQRRGQKVDFTKSTMKVLDLLTEQTKRLTRPMDEVSALADETTVKFQK